MSEQPFLITRPKGKRVPIVLSVPHCGTAFPEELREEFRSELIAFPDDTDWFADRLYEFAPTLGITMITARFSRWVIDLNRSPDNKPLYNDGRLITELCPTTTLLGESLYRDGRHSVEDTEVARRIRMYYDPYHTALAGLLRDAISTFGKVLLWDCHSIRQVVPTIQKERFPDLILGSADGRAASAELISIATAQLREGPYSFQYNHPFKGGYITRHYGQPERGQHALQLEMTKVQYMNDSETEYEPPRAEKMAELLNKTLSSLANALI